ncbi:MAG: hypothetical protein OK454_08530 [Thaumarchaeota archaeon]|nr:hypothetical protein [Nitrososphaerota archaeon]
MRECDESVPRGRPGQLMRRAKRGRDDVRGGCVDSKTAEAERPPMLIPPPELTLSWGPCDVRGLFAGKGSGGYSPAKARLEYDEEVEGLAAWTFWVFEGWCLEGMEPVRGPL